MEGATRYEEGATRYEIEMYAVSLARDHASGNDTVKASLTPYLYFQHLGLASRNAYRRLARTMLLEDMDDIRTLSGPGKPRK